VANPTRREPPGGSGGREQFPPDFRSIITSTLEQEAPVSLGRKHVLLIVCGLLALMPAAVRAEQATGPDEALSRKIDAVMSETYKPGQPGAAIIIRKDGRTIFRKGYGLADLELGVPVEPDMVFRLGSITKQFTAVSILMLADSGRLSLQDEITKFLPDYPTQGKRITIEHLLTHTSGIKSYTNLPEWLSMWRKDMTVREIIDLSKDKPLEFAPGDRWNYNNSGYVLLGAVIEKVSGLSYEDFIQKNIFDPLGMKHSYYGSTERIIPRRVQGYQEGRGGIVNAPFLSMTQPYAAGSLLSSVDDLAVWNEAVFSARLLPQKWLDQAWTPFKLSSGESTGYGFGWFVSDYAGHRFIEHGGGINGFTTYEMTLPEDRIYLAILTNSTIDGRGPEPRAFKIATLVLGVPEPERKPVALSASDVRSIVGVYENAEGQARYITGEGGKLYSQRAGNEKSEIFASSPSELFFASSPARIRLVRNEKGEVTGLRVNQRIGPAEVYAKTAKPLPTPRREVAVDSRILDEYVGEYELAPSFIVKIVNDKGRLISEATGQPKVELFAESPSKFFLKDVDAQVEFIRDASGKVTGLSLTQGGMTMPAKKIK
jgi:CubicO group peptidase (beta-lactamase class C family)